jgi:hypothetical protein
MNLQDELQIARAITRAASYALSRGQQAVFEAKAESDKLQREWERAKLLEESIECRFVEKGT